MERRRHVDADGTGISSGQPAKSIAGPLVLGFLLTILLFFQTFTSAQAADEQLCWKQNYTRGVGTIPTDCPAGKDKDAGLCYSKCPSGYSGVGPVCWQTCPSGFRDDGAFCAKPAPYGRGAGYPWQFGDPIFSNTDSGQFARCERDNGAGNCEKNGLVVYPKCKPGYFAVGCCVCSPVCPSGMTDIGVSCTKNTSTRGVGTIPACGSGLQLDAGLCYPPPIPGYDGVGPVAWAKCTGEYPFNCGAGCAKNQAACATAVTDMTLNTAGVAINLLSWFAGGPGITAAAQKAVTNTLGYGKTFGMRFVGLTLKEELKRTARFTAQAVTTDAKGFAKEFVIAYAKNQIKPANFRWTAASGLKAGGLKAANEAAKEFAGLKTTGEFNWEDLKILDLTGIASMVTAFTKYTNCALEDLASDTQEVDFGNGPASSARTITLFIQQPTTIKEITTTPFAGAVINADTDCLGKLIQTGQKCLLDISVSGSGKIEGDVNVYTDNYDIIPFAISVKANNNAAPAVRIQGTDDAVNLSSVVGVWAWNRNQQNKVIVQSNGIAKRGTLSGNVAVVDPAKRIYKFTWNDGAIETLTLAADRQELAGKNQSGAAISSIRRTLDPRCNPGEMFYAGLCYDVPPDYFPTAPGFMGKACPVGWRDDGTRCWPNWTGVDVPVQAAKTGAFKYPIVVTDCANYSQAKQQKCPANFANTGGPLGCSCEAKPVSKEVQSIIGHFPLR
jgi:hypothetical protein